MRTEEIVASFQAAGQGHVFAFWPELDQPRRDALVAQAREIDLDEVARLHRKLVVERSAAATAPRDLQPAPYEPLPQHGGNAGDDGNGGGGGGAAGWIAVRTRSPLGGKVTSSPAADLGTY